jgi:hypothetical protein
MAWLREFGALRACGRKGPQTELGEFSKSLPAEGMIATFDFTVRRQAPLAARRDTTTKWLPPVRRAQREYV